MKVQDLVKFDASLKLVKNIEWPEEILAISALDNLLTNSFVFIKNAKFLERFLPFIDKAAELKVGVVIDEKFYQLMNTDLKKEIDKLPWIGTSLQVPLTLTLLSKPFYDQKMKGINTQVDGRQMGTTDIDPSAYIAQNVFIGEHVKIGAKVTIMPGCVILPHCEIGEGTTLYPNVSIYSFSKIGKNCRIHSSVVIGSDGFGYTFHQGRHLKIWHMGGVEIHDDVEIGSCSTVDAGTFSPTIIGAGTRIDNSVQVAHNCKIGKGCILCGHSGLAGSAVIEDYVVLGGKAGVGPDAHLGMGTQVAGAAMVNEGAIWPAGSKLGGHPARDLKEWMKGFAYIRKMSLKENK
ncbi:MAG: UDP-3-O-(3-hydroxymyristoyl)glucosamine N-acyltransferase [Bacteriovoracaceae bacterium]